MYGERVRVVEEGRAALGSSIDGEGVGGSEVAPKEVPRGDVVLGLSTPSSGLLSCEVDDWEEAVGVKRGGEVARGTMLTQVSERDCS